MDFDEIISDIGRNIRLFERKEAKKDEEEANNNPVETNEFKEKYNNLKKIFKILKKDKEKISGFEYFLFQLLYIYIY